LRVGCRRHQCRQPTRRSRFGAPPPPAAEALLYVASSRRDGGGTVRPVGRRCSNSGGTP